MLIPRLYVYDLHQWLHQSLNSPTVFFVGQKTDWQSKTKFPNKLPLSSTSDKSGSIGCLDKKSSSVAWWSGPSAEESPWIAKTIWWRFTMGKWNGGTCKKRNIPKKKTLWPCIDWQRTRVALGHWQSLQLHFRPWFQVWIGMHSILIAQLFSGQFSCQKKVTKLK